MCGYVLLCVVACCSVLQCFAVCCSVLQCVAVCCYVLICVVACCENKPCLDLYSQSLDAREKIWIKLVHEPPKPPIVVECRKCGFKPTQSRAKKHMVAHLKLPENNACLELYSDSTIPREMAWVRAVRDTV